MAIRKTLECDYCDTTAEYTEQKSWVQLYLTPIGYSPSYNEGERLLCPKCQKDLEFFMRREETKCQD